MCVNTFLAAEDAPTHFIVTAPDRASNESSIPVTTPVRYSEEGITEHHNIGLPFVRLVSGCCMDQTCAPEPNKLCPVGVIDKRVQKGCLMGDRDRDTLHNKAAASVWPRDPISCQLFVRVAGKTM